MKKSFAIRHSLFLAAILATSSFSFADALDDALNDKPAPAPAAKPDAPAKTGAEGNGGGEGAGSNEPKVARPKLPELISPDAAKTLDEQDLLNKLTGEGKAGDGKAGDPSQKMNEIMERMGQSETKLFKERDPGLLTQEVQNRIVIDLDNMIELLKKQQSKGGGKGKGEPKEGEKKQETSTAKTSGSKQEGGNDAAITSQLPSGGIQNPNGSGTDIHEGRINWGDLPLRDRDLIANGANEKFLPEYKEMIQRYYEALAELGKSEKER